jgi:hypothetical protein
MQDSPLPLSVNNRLPYQVMSSASSFPFLSFADQSTFSFPSKPLLPVPRQPSVDSCCFVSNSSFPFLSRHVSLASVADSFDADSLNFPSFDGDLPACKADLDSFDLTSRVSSFESLLSSWSSVASDDSCRSVPRSPQSSADSMLDLSQSDAELYSPYTSPVSYPLRDHWVQPPFQKMQRQAASLLLRAEESQVRVGAGSTHSSNFTIPVLPLPFNQPVYSFNYHSVDEPVPQPQTSGYERREGLRGGGDSRQQQEQRSYPHHERSDVDNGRVLDSASAASMQLSITMSTATSSRDAISPKSLLLSLCRTPASTSPHYSHTSLFSPSSSSSPTPVTSIQLNSHMDPNEIVVGTYTRAERAAKIARYREKRANRQWRKKILYGCRKSFADARPRIGGRFIQMKPTEGEEK